MNATQSGIGQVVAEKPREEVYRIFRIFEFIVVNLTVWLISAAIVMTIPFVKFYTRNVPDVEYVNLFLWLVIPLNISIQLFHIPSGNHYEYARQISREQKFSAPQYSA
jgi:hypothetical protein